MTLSFSGIVHQVAWNACLLSQPAGRKPYEKHKQMSTLLIQSNFKFSRYESSFVNSQEYGKIMAVCKPLSAFSSIGQENIKHAVNIRKVLAVFVPSKKW